MLIILQITVETHPHRLPIPTSQQSTQQLHGRHVDTTVVIK